LNNEKVNPTALSKNSPNTPVVSDVSSEEDGEQPVSFRDRIATIDEEGRRKWIYAHKVSGPLHTARNIFHAILLIIFFAGPFITINGHPALLLDIIHRRFVILGVAFWPQDFHIFVLAMVAGIVAILLFTAVYGRLFCGWACPQTVFMESVFRRIEYWIEGDAPAQKKLNAAPWTWHKIYKKGLKHTIFYGLSFTIGNWFLMYIMGKDAWWKLVTDPPTLHLTGLFIMIIFSGVFYFVFAFFREQVCTLVCPYGRFQSVLLDPNSIVISYDFVRGEPRAKLGRNRPSDAGDCIDCHQCVDVCPTGIDIRNGTQLECINCTNCIDACNHVMEKVGKPKGLIRYASYNSIKTGNRKVFTPRVLGYSVVLLLLITLVGVMLASRTPTETTILRAPGSLFQVQPDGKISNLYTVKIVNKSFESLPVSFRLLQPQGELKLVGKSIIVPPQSVSRGALFVILPRSEVKGSKVSLKIGVLSKGELIEKVSTAFMGPLETP